jgi:hypothetical protein
MMDAEPLRNPANILISVVIPAFKEADNVLRVIRHASTHMQTQLRTEFIVAVVDDESAQRLEESELPITVVRCSSGRSSALNAGAALARGEVVNPAQPFQPLPGSHHRGFLCSGLAVHTPRQPCDCEETALTRTCLLSRYFSSSMRTACFQGPSFSLTKTKTGRKIHPASLDRHCKF